MQKIGIFSRKIDLLIVILCMYFLWSCIFIERHYCANALKADDTNPLLKATYEYSEKYNPLFLQRPEWLQISTCISAYFLGAGYILIVTMLIGGFEQLRGIATLFIGAKLYAIMFYYYFEFFGDLPAPSIPFFLAADGPYGLGLVLCLYRFVLTRGPLFHTKETLSRGKKKRQ
mmetsp:Transcript_12812/g.19401  ORF Transcript_12812/g.19401 Transcript_12812/m.19401 type:complete len:173 (+) Transcript_12812:38-556(+)